MDFTNVCIFSENPIWWFDEEKNRLKVKVYKLAPKPPMDDPEGRMTQWLLRRAEALFDALEPRLTPIDGVLYVWRDELFVKVMVNYKKRYKLLNLLRELNPEIRRTIAYHLV